MEYPHNNSRPGVVKRWQSDSVHEHPCSPARDRVAGEYAFGELVTADHVRRSADAVTPIDKPAAALCFRLAGTPGQRRASVLSRRTKPWEM